VVLSGTARCEGHSAAELVVQRVRGRLGSFLRDILGCLLLLVQILDLPLPEVLKLDEKKQ